MTAVWNTPTYQSWLGMRRRCKVPTARGFSSYGGRGIRVCSRWDSSFSAFLQDMGEKPSPKHSLDRINNDGNYEPGNCRWATAREQANNRRTNRIVVLYGEEMTMTEACRRHGVSHGTVKHRLSAGVPLEEALLAPKMTKLEVGQLTAQRRRARGIFPRRQRAVHAHGTPCGIPSPHGRHAAPPLVARSGESFTCKRCCAALRRQTLKRSRQRRAA